MAEYEVTADGKEILKTLPLTGVRKVIANNLKESWQGLVPMSGFFKYDCTNLIAYKKKLAEEGVKVSFTDLFVALVAEAIRVVPQANAAITEKRIEIYKSVNIGVAVAAPDGSLIVPVLKGVENMGLKDISAGLQDLAKRTREGKIGMADLTGGTITVSSTGMFDTYGFTQIPAKGQSFILGFGTIRDEPAVLEDKTIGIRPIMYVSATADHRVIQGDSGTLFLRTIRDGILDPEKMIRL